LKVPTGFARKLANLVRWTGAVLAVVALAGGGCGRGNGSAQPAATHPHPSAHQHPSAHRHPGDPTGPVTVAAPESLTETFTRLGKEFEAAYPGTTVVFRFGSGVAGGAGARPDVVAGGPSELKPVTDAALAQDTPTLLARDSLVIAVLRANTVKVSSLADLTRPGVRVALCADQLPCGAAARTVLDAAGVTVSPVARESDVHAIIAKIRSGAVDAALVYRTDVKALYPEVTSIDVAEAERAADQYRIVALKESANPAAAAAFIGFVTSALGRRVFAEAGFGVP
jgi:molybdate transport system substrate-binding protein